MAAPAYPEIGQELLRLWRDLLKRLIEELLGPLREIRHVVQFEGSASILKRADGSSQQVQMVGIQSTATIFTRAATPESILAGFKQLAEDFARKQSQSFYEVMGKVCDDAGQTFDARGQKLSANLLLKGLQMTQIDFDEVTGAPQFPKLIVGPGQEVAVRELVASQNDPEVKSKFAALVAEKYEAWRDREADRKLVG